MVAKQRFIDNQRKPYLISLATELILMGDNKGSAVKKMKEANKLWCDPPLLMRDMPIYYEDARKKAAVQGNENLAAMEAEAATGAGAALQDTDAEKVANVIAKAQELYRLETKLASLNAEVAPLAARYNELTSKELPEAMKAAGVGDRFPLANGWTVLRRAQLVANLPTPSAIAKERDPDVQATMQTRLTDGLAFLVKTGNQGLIKDQFQINLKKGETNRAKGIENFLNKRSIPFVHDKTVHPQTLGAFVREQVKEGNDIPFELFAVYEAATVKLIAPKED